MLYKEPSGTRREIVNQNHSYPKCLSYDTSVRNCCPYSQPALGELIAELLKTMLPDAVNKNVFIDETPSSLTLNTDFHCVPHSERKDMVALAFGFPNFPPLD
jgi:hypothetical protein